jgi:sulfite reductase alpha subunit-like flavoprotein/nitric oxide synthase oxygenase domain/subunit
MIFQEVRQHLLEATAGTSIQSIMTVFKPQMHSEPFGARFWSSQLVRYAAYKHPLTGKILGDPANLELTEYLVYNKLWEPPDETTQFDVLPIVLKLSGVKTPLVHELPKDCIFEVALEHPTNPELSSLGLRWTTVPAISNFKMNLGGIVYQNMPFNGWFMSTEIVRNLMERYEDVGPDVANIIGLDIQTDPMWRQTASCELERMVIHSFQKNGYTIVDPMTVGRSFCSHVQREREQFGRECPGQWSWIGGLVGPTNPTWHLEMRDFLINPQYEYCSEGMLLHAAAEQGRDDRTVSTSITDNNSMTSLMADVQQVPNILILYGSETGNAEAIARRLKREFRLAKPILKSLNEAKGLQIVKNRKITHILAICSTFGKGDAPANARDFFNTAIIKLPESTKFAVLALGSTIYPDFCQAGVNLDKMLQKAGLERAMNLTQADEAAGSEGPIAEWINLVKNFALPPMLRDYMMEAALGSDNKPPVHSLKWLSGEEESQFKLSASATSSSLCISNTELLEAGGSKSIRKISFETPVPYESGDHLSVVPRNTDQLVKRFLRCFETELRDSAGSDLGITKDTALDSLLDQVSDIPVGIHMLEGQEVGPADVFFESPTTLAYLLKAKLDLSLRAKDVPDFLQLIKRLLDEMMEPMEKEDRNSLLTFSNIQVLIPLTHDILQVDSKARTTTIDDFVASYPTVVDFFESFKDVLLDNFFGNRPVVRMAEILVILNRLQPRYYSISSSEKVNAKEVTITVGVLNIETSEGVKMNGVSSNYLASLQAGTDRAIVAVHKSSFRLPADPKAPILMVGAGTGLSPMMGFLESKALEKKNGMKSGPIHLFFGCRTEKDFIYEDLIRGFEKDGLVDVHLALSRSLKTPKKYVQDTIHDMGKEIANFLLREDAHYYVCGDARMADACYEVCVSLLREHAVMSRVAAANYLKHMRMEWRWQTDVWGIVSHFEDAKKDIMKSKRMAAKLWMSHFKADDEDSI